MVGDDTLEAKLSACCSCTNESHIYLSDEDAANGNEKLSVKSAVSKVKQQHCFVGGAGGRGGITHQRRHFVSTLQKFLSSSRTRWTFEGLNS